MGTSAKSLDANLTPILQDLTLATRHAQLFECSLSIDRIIAFMTDLVAPHFAEFSGVRLQ